ncbi:MAG: acyl-CoA dehydratase activase [Armatimonadota bacterium]
MIYAGIDAGSRAIKIVFIDADSREVTASGITDQGIKSDELAVDLFDKLLSDITCRREDVAQVVATGYARNIISIADRTVTEITCHARGVHHLMPDVRTIVEIGGQDSKLLKLDENGVLYDFSMNDRCAAGTGRFLEVVADRFGMEIHRLGEMASKSKSPASISSMCVVFAETEIIGLLASGASPEDIVAGVQNSIASRVVAMAGRNIFAPIAFTGGVALIEGMDTALDKAFGKSVTIVPDPQMTGALGAAILASGK